jgi:hypothetical protein
MDAFERWYEMLREQGEVLDSKSAHFDSPTAEPQRWILPHEGYDASKVIERILRDLGKPPPALLRIRETRPPPFVARLRAVWREISEARRPPVPWRRFDPAARGSLETVVAHAFFDRDEVEALARRAEARGARTNSFLLWALDRAIYGELASPSPEHRWAVPVTLRGAVGRLEALANVASFVGVNIVEGASPADVKNAIKSQLEHNAHWGSWYAFRLMGYLGSRFMRRYAVKYYARPTHSWVGTFSNVGPFEEDAGWIYAVPPVTRTHPVSASATTVGGRMTLGIHTHPVLGKTDVGDLVSRWRAYIEGKA